MPNNSMLPYSQASENNKLPIGLTIERDTMFEPMKAKDVWDKLNRGEHV